MSGNDKPLVTIEDLHAYADGQLPAGRAGEVEAYLLVHPDAAARVEDYRAINTAVREAFALEAMDLASPAPQYLPRTRRFPAKIAIAATLTGLILGGGAGWTFRGYATTGGAGLQELAQRASAAYTVYGLDTTQPVEMAAADASRLAAWLSRRMEMAVRIPNLSPAGFTLMGGRLMVGNSAPAAMLMYENAQGQRIVLYIRNDLPEGEATKMHYRRTGSGGTVYWRDALAGFGLAGGLSEQELIPLANFVRADFSL